MTPSFVTRDFKTLTGEAARLRLMAVNDREFLSRENGIVSVSRERWEIAQDAEAHGWLDLWKGAVEDRNSHHYALFDYFLMLGDRSFDRAIELGCGPFTNLRFIASASKIAALELLDPLAERYIELPNCTYRDGRLRRIDGGSSPIDAVHSIPIEEMNIDERFDLVVLINVIEHCFDAERIFSNVWSLLRRGGVFVFHDKYYDHKDVAAEVLSSYDTGHPLKVDRRLVDTFLSRFAPVFSRRTTTFGAARMTDIGDAIYFVGERP
jgi:SAM-dependent methyltransferase